MTPNDPPICLLPVTAPSTGGTDVASSPKDVADLLDVVAQANDRLAAEVDRILGTRAAVSDITVNRLVKLADELRPGAAARAELRALSELDTGLLLAGMSCWLDRRRAASPAAALAAQRWLSA